MTDTPSSGAATLFLARHGETVWHEENRYTGVSDIALTPRGLDQAEALGAWAAGAGLDAVVTSPLSRARRTAEPAARATGIAPDVEPGLKEVDFGIAEGRTLDELRASHPEAAAAFLANPAAHPFPAGEDPFTAAARGAAALHRVAAARPGRRVLVVAHNTLFRLVLCHLLGIPESRYRQVFPALRNCATTEVRLSRAGAALLSLNVPT
ncbi:putative mutase [Actinacidiphila reveromycinica]|uniref:Putative mutase n=1 Tax=Actinacidiphila reveromycinica TaxID=659352 RepID=A0A7U3VMI9_9ACTN|nr:histidine phosphatase family protein [Streptomyces sp. SN-593]BBA96609.1 putative mutase [Streptomyces sp. SN-593]